jgi:hypothetical protein
VLQQGFEPADDCGLGTVDGWPLLGAGVWGHEGPGAGRLASLVPCALQFPQQ